MAFFRSALVVLLIVVTASCATREKLDEGDRTSSSSSAQTEEHFNFIEHTSFPSVGSLYNVNNTFVGSCVLVSPSSALTAGHCIEFGKLKYARFGDETLLIDVQCLHKNYDTGDDLGLLLFSTPSKNKPMPIMNDVNIIPKTYPIYTIAHGGGRKKISKDGVYHFYGILKSNPNEITFLPLKTSVWFGDSGGALVCRIEDGNYALIGIITHFSTMGEQIYECAARRADNFNIYDDVWQPWITK
tara:strand:- start:51 stop:779 length:729 start_codon:yes stop_codon:yes gene_type:complete